MITNQGLDHLLDVALNGGTQVTTWYVGLIRDDNYSALAAADTMSSHAGWEEGTEFAEAVRQTWVEAAASSQVTATTTEATFTINADQTFKGFFVASVSTVGGTTGTLLLTSLFAGGDRAMVAGQQLKISLSITSQDATAS
jgi:hypothetical protein